MIWKKIIQAVITMGIGGVMLKATQGLIANTDTTGMSEANKAILGLSPIVLAIIIIVCAFSIFFAGQAIIRYLKWRDFGNRMKSAYVAKFGYPNPAFDKEIDAHVLAMEALGKGYTKSLDKDWLKRMASFVEVPWAIPEEEHLSETDKTELFGEDK